MKLLERRTLFRDGEYVSFPNLAWIDQDTLACFFRHAKDRRAEYGTYTHIDPTAKDVFIVSNDNGERFDPALHTVLDDDMSEQDPCAVVLSCGRIIVSCFRWRIVAEGSGPEIWGRELFARYGRTRAGMYDTFNIGFSVNSSDDRGKTWRHLPVIQPEGYLPGSAARGNIVEMPDGSLLLPFYGVRNIGELARSAVVKSEDRGETWRFFSEIAADPEKNFLEPALYRTPSGRLIALMRTQSDFLKPGVDFESTYLNLHRAVSDDGGISFGPVQEVPSLRGSNPFHVLSLRGGTALVNYGYRFAPFGIRAKLCDAELSNLETAPEFVVCDDALSGDLGYTHAVQLKDGRILLAYYIAGPDGTRAIEGAVIQAD
jgi:hypothetical protein